MNTRRERLREIMGNEELEAMVVTQPQNRRYLSGFTGSAGALLITHREAILIIDFRYLEQGQREAPECQVVREDRTEPLGKEFALTLHGLLTDMGIRRVGFESHHLTVAQYQEWLVNLEGCQITATREMVEGLRAGKEPQELETIKRAVDLADETYHHLRGFLRPGMMEREVAWEAESYLRTHGADETSFKIIVASGPNGAMPHAVTSERAIRKREPIVIDMGAEVDGYRSDLTRTAYMGEPDDKFVEIYDLVLKAQETAERGIKPGMKGKDADAVARQVIEDAGYGEYFGHGLGHGVGLAVHEKPLANRSSEDELMPGMVLTVEPGIYIPGWGGVRVEDMVVLTENGLEVLTKSDKVM